MYFVTTVDSRSEDTRCVGYFKTFEEAERVVTHNLDDIWETCYDYAVIENIPEGLYQYDFHPTWYKFYKTVNGYIECEQPAFVKAISGVGYAIG